MAAGPAVIIELAGMRFPGDPMPLYRGFRLSVAPGEVVALVGPSGVGKTTLLRLIGGTETGFEGSVEIDGVPADRAPVPGMVFQDARLLPWLTVAGNLRAVNPELSAEAIAEALGRVGLTGLGGAWPRQLSGGMQRRLGLARALSVNPRLLLLDEPFVSLDRASVTELQALFLRVFRSTQPTVIIVSHDPEDAARLADRAVLLHRRPVRVLADIALPEPDGDRDDPLVIARRVQALRDAAAVETVP